MISNVHVSKEFSSLQQCFLLLLSSVLGFPFFSHFLRTFTFEYSLGRRRRDSLAALNRQQCFLMNWIILFVAGLCEVGFSYCLGRAKSVEGLEWWTWMGGFFVFTILSMVLLAKATQTLPLGTAYPVWTGIGAVGTVLVGIFVFHESASFCRLFFITTLLGSIIGLKVLS